MSLPKNVISNPEPKNALKANGCVIGTRAIRRDVADRCRLTTSGGA